jgi:hypothetical protein
MAFSDYQVYLIDPSTGDALDLLDARRLQALTYSRVVNDVGRFSLTIRSGDPAAQYKTLTNLLVEIYRRNTPTGDFIREDTYFLRAFEMLEDGGQDYLIWSGEHILALFRDRLIIPDDDPSGANGYSTKSGIADLVMYEFVDNQIINPTTNIARAEPVSNAASQNLGLPVFQRKTYQDTLLETLQQCSVLGTVDFTLTRVTSTATLLFTVGFVGSDLTYDNNYPSTPYLIYQPNNRNIRNPSMKRDSSEEQNVVYVGLQGIEEDRQFVPIQTPSSYAPFNRRETTTDAREIDDDPSYVNAIQTVAYEVLRDKQPQVIFEFEIETSVSLYNVDWRLGDRITARYLDYQEDLRINSVEISLSANNEAIKPIFQK